jgi:hypothetical protein
VQTLNEGIIQKKHDSGQIPRCFRIPEQHLANITDIPGFWVSKAELPLCRGQPEDEQRERGDGSLYPYQTINDV